jgi:FKBP-type peptidyl-prolyl cis-trans isomerase FkpA
MIKYSIVATIIILAFGCSEQPFKNFETTDNGLKYQFHVLDDSRNQVRIYDVVEVYMNYRTPDSLLFSSYPQTIPFQIEPVFDGDLMEGLMLMHRGDSATFVINTEAFYLKMMQFSEIPDHSKNHDELWFDVKIVNIIPETASIKARRLEFHERKNNESERIAAYLKSKNYNTNPLENGLYYIEQKEGSGNVPNDYDIVQIHFTASFLDGRLFDSSYEHEKPLAFTIGGGEVIEGLEAGVRLMKQGGKATLIIPSELAYGGLRRDEVKPFTPLVFDIEIIQLVETNF